MLSFFFEFFNSYFIKPLSKIIIKHEIYTIFALYYIKNLHFDIDNHFPLCYNNLNGVIMDDQLSINLYEKCNDSGDIFVWKAHENLGYPAHFHRAIELHFVLTGSMFTKLNDTQYEIKAGQGFVINPFTIHKHEKSESTFVNVLILSNEYLEDFKAEYYGNVFPVILDDIEFNKSILNILKDVPFSFQNNTTLSPLEKKGYANLILGKIATHYGTTTPTALHKEITNIVSYIYNNYNQKITLETLAEEFHYTKTSISRLLHKHLETDLRCFINTLRAEEAEKLLNSPEGKKMTVLEISSVCGFDSIATFYRTYKKVFNRLPSKN